jgi:hypothetical protein
MAVGDWVDVRDVSGLWIEGQVVSKKGTYVEVHCNGYPDCYNEWVEQGSHRLMPLRTQTVQPEDCPYLSPFPINKPQIREPKSSSYTIGKLVSELPDTLRSVAWLVDELDLKPEQDQEFK